MAHTRIAPQREGKPGSKPTRFLYVELSNVNRSVPFQHPGLIKITFSTLKMHDR